jgi:FlaA1/EpsC-like NDP-sugar epimerase
MELRRKYPELKLTPIIADIQDRFRINEVFSVYQPEVVFHAAAHKHVPLMERNPSEAVKNNVLGTKNVAECADLYGVERFVLISTDKAVNPTSVMGATKRVAELIVQSLNQSSKTIFTAVRFGNVLGSRGSVIPLFKKQIEQGGPVTVTDPEMVRYFMTIPEAVQLVLQAGALTKGGEVFILDMGEPVKIVDLAQDLIRMSGYVPYEEIDIQFTGIRPGEKLYEEILTKEEGATSTMHDRIFISLPAPWSSVQMEEEIRQLEAVLHESPLDIKQALKQVVPSFNEQVS